MSQENNSATGTANNDAYQEIRAQINGLNKQMMGIYESMSDTTLTDEQREAKGKEMENLENSMISAIKAGINKNITNPVGVLLLKQNYYYMDVADLDPLMPQIPAAYDNDEAIVKIKNNVEKMKATAVGQKFTELRDADAGRKNSKTVRLRRQGAKFSSLTSGQAGAAPAVARCPTWWKLTPNTRTRTSRLWAYLWTRVPTHGKKPSRS